MDDGRMIMQQGDITIKDDEDRLLSGKEALDYLKEKRKTMLKITTILDIGDKVKLNKLDEPVIVELNDGNLFKYGGYNSSTVDSLIMFNQEDIEEILEKTK